MEEALFFVGRALVGAGVVARRLDRRTKKSFFHWVFGYHGDFLLLAGGGDFLCRDAALFECFLHGFANVLFAHAAHHAVDCQGGFVHGFAPFLYCE